MRFLAHGPGYSFFLTPQEALLALDSSGAASVVSRSPFSPALANPAALASGSAGALVGMQFLNANPQPAVTGEHLLPGIVNYFQGNNPARWHTNIPTYAQVRYHNIYPGIDLVYYGNQGHLEYDFIASPGSDPSLIHLNFTGANGLSLDAQDELLLHLAAGDLAEGAPQVYQEINGAQQRVASRYVLQGATEVGFTLGAYDPSQPLVIDPSVFFSTYLGSSDNDYVKSVAIDSACSIYMTGATSSTHFPSQNPLQAASGGSTDAFVTKMSADGTTLLYSTYLGGSGSDWGNGIAVDSAGNAYITGVTFSTDFPTQNALQPAAGGGADDAFVAELNAAGSALTYSTYLGGGGLDWATAIAVDSAGNAYITGGTSSGADSTTSFPTHNPRQSSIAGNVNAFVAEVGAGGSALLYSTYLGGSNYDYGAGIAVDSTGDAYVTGVTRSSDFPTQAPLFAYGGADDAFVAKLNTNGSTLLYSTYLGGSGDDGGFGIAVDSAGDAYITGSTSSTNFPVHNALQAANAGGTDAFITEINSAGSGLVYSTYLGGSKNDMASSIAVDSANDVYITGSTSSTNFPIHNALQAANAGGTDVFVASVSASGSTLLFSSYLGGKSNDWGNGIAVDSTSNIYVAGATASSNFPTLHPVQGYSGMEDGFLTKIDVAFPAFNNEGMIRDGQSVSASFDGVGYSYSANALQAAGFAPGAAVTIGGFTFHWPNISAGVSDNWQTAGQVIPLTAPAGATILGFLGSATNGPASGTVTLTYSDGSTTTATLAFSDWTLNGSKSSVLAGNTIVARLGYRNRSSGTTQAVTTYLFLASVPLAAGKTLQSVTLPSTVTQGHIHVFALATSSSPLPPAFNNQGIIRDGQSVSASFDGVGYSYSANALQAAGFAPGAAVTVSGFTFHWPTDPTDLNDNWQTAGQVVPLAAPAGATVLGFLGSATNGPASGTITLTYSDGSTTTATLAFSDWTLNGGKSSVLAGDSIVARLGYRNRSSGTTQAVTTYLFLASVPLAAGKTLQSVTLPSTVTQGHIHVFALATSSSPLPPAFNNQGIIRDGQSVSASFDGVGYSYSANALQAAGFAPGAAVTVSGFTFHWPTDPTDLNDNWQTAGQVIPLAAPAGATVLGFLGSATNGPASGTVTLTYTDGSTTTATLAFSDWTLNGGTGSILSANSFAAVLGYRNRSSGTTQAVTTYLFLATVPLAAGKTLQSVTLPGTVTQGNLHVFALATSSLSALSLALNNQGVSPNGQSNFTSVSGVVNQGNPTVFLMGIPADAAEAAAWNPRWRVLWRVSHREIATAITSLKECSR